MSDILKYTYNPVAPLLHTHQWPSVGLGDGMSFTPPSDRSLPTSPACLPLPSHHDLNFSPKLQLTVEPLSAAPRLPEIPFHPSLPGYVQPTPQVSGERCAPPGGNLSYLLRRVQCPLCFLSPRGTSNLAGFAALGCLAACLSLSLCPGHDWLALQCLTESQ